MSAPDETNAFTFESDEASLISDAVIAKLKQEYSDSELRLYQAEGYAVVCRAPNRGEYKRWRHMAYDTTTRETANETLFGGCVVYPEKEALNKIFDRRPGLADLWGDKLSTWAGAGAKTAEKKL